MYYREKKMGDLCFTKKQKNDKAQLIFLLCNCYRKKRGGNLITQLGKYHIGHILKFICFDLFEILLQIFLTYS